MHSIFSKMVPKRHFSKHAAYYFFADSKVQNKVDINKYVALETPL